MATRPRRAQRSDDAFRDTLLPLIFGLQFFSEDSEETLRELWQQHGDELTSKFTAADPTRRPAAYFWWSCPARIRIPYPQRLMPTEQRQRLIAGNVLRGEARVAALKHIAAFERSGMPMSSFDHCRHPDRIPDVPLEIFY